MKKILSGLIVIGLLGCGGPRQKHEKELPAGAPISLDDQPGTYFREPEMVSYRLSAAHEGVLVNGTFTLALSCNNVFGTGQNGDWVQNSVSVTSSLSLPAGKSCQVTLTNYNDGTNTYTATGTSLVTTVSTSGAITSASASQYTTGGGSPIKQWFFASQVSTYSIQFNYAADAITATTVIVPTSISIQSVSLAVGGVAAPTVSNLTLYSTAAINGASAAYTLVATVTGSTACKYIDNSSSTYDPTSWNSVNTAYNNVGATTCPSFTPASDGSSTGNWTSEYGGTGQKTLIMWANTVNGLSAYTTANF